MKGISDACAGLLVEARRYAPLYGDRLANHLPMALVALDRLGADRAAMRRFADGYARRLQPAAPSASALDPHDLLGSGGDYPRFLRFFQDRIREAGSDAVLRDWVPVLMPGLAASAFHAMIRLAYALDSGLDDEIALALADWASEYAALPLSQEAAGGALDEIAGALRATMAGHVFRPGIIIDKMLELAWDPALAGACVQPRAAPTLAAIARFGLDAYAEREDFTLLHVVTACHAFRLVQPFVSDHVQALRYLWQAVLMAWLSIALTPPGRDARARDWPDLGPEAIAAQARAAGDDHVIKLCHTALCEHEAYGDRRYLMIAARKLCQIN